MHRRRNVSLIRSLVIIAIILNVLLTIFHVLVMVKVIPYNMVWGGRISTFDEAIQMETASIIGTIIIILITSVGLSKRIINRTSRYSYQYKLSLLAISAFFGFNMLSNFASDNSFEKMIFIPLTSVFILLYLSIYRLLRK